MFNHVVIGGLATRSNALLGYKLGRVRDRRLQAVTVAHCDSASDDRKQLSVSRRSALMGIGLAMMPCVLSVPSSGAAVQVATPQKV